MPKRPNINYCRQLRKEQTDAESLLWKYVRNRQIEGVKFRRQYSIGQYILDFYASELKLAIEIDGGQHYEEKGKIKDAQRSAYLKSQGIVILRFPNNEVLGNLEGVYDTIMAKVDEMSPSSRPSPQRGEGE